MPRSPLLALPFLLVTAPALAQPDAAPPDAAPDLPDAGPPDAGGDGAGPTLSILDPVDGDEVSGVVTIEVEASDLDGVARVEFLVDDMLRGSDGSAPYTHLWQTANYQPGDHTVAAVAYDSFDNAAEVSVTVTVGGEEGEGDDGGDGDASGGGVGDAGPDGAGDEPRVDPISWGCAAVGGGAGDVCGLATALGLALLLAALARTAAAGSKPRGRRK